MREYDRLTLERGPVRFGPWTIESDAPGLEVRTWQPGDRLAGRSRKVQDVFTDAKVPRRERATWPLVVRENEVVVDPRDRGQSRGEREALIEITSELERGVGDVLIDADALRTRIGELGEEISDYYRGRDLLLVGVLKGAVFFMADLMRHLTVPCEVDFMAITSYGASTDSSGVVRILKDLDINIEGRHVLVVEDIVDSGLTLSYLMRNLESREPASLEVCALMTKPSRREIDVPVRWVGFEIPNKFVIGYGLDFAERYRNLPYVGVLSEDLIPEGA